MQDLCCCCAPISSCSLAVLGACHTSANTVSCWAMGLSPLLWHQAA